MKKIRTGKQVLLTTLFYSLVIAGTLALSNSCNKSKTTTNSTAQTTDAASVKTTTPQTRTLTQTVTIAKIRKSGDGTVSKIMFNQLAEVFSVTDATLLANLQTAFEGKKTIQVTFDPWQGKVIQMATAAQKGISKSVTTTDKTTAITVDLEHMTDKVVNDLPAAAMLNTTTDSLTSVIPDMATAQLMFDFITHQACALAGPYGIDQCISFQYCQDGCYARAHKMCWIINNKYHYATHKIFSFANAGNDELCVQAQKWGGCCVNWWYHVAPIVNVKTPSGTKAYVFDAAMFDQPVLLATWLHAQENPACVPTGDVPHVSMINIQPTASYTPADGTGYSFDTDPLYLSTNSTMVSYSPLKTCP
ncbi:MAG: hypothetical protein JWQ38_1933 [Flavipsychrobacter sp.]|nr:hypothetical protein [Flavipsychrobacter sp.]